jgi:hypothetical protein
MSRIFHRPMFRTGGSAEGGITSGLRQEYKRGRVVEPGGYKGNEDFFDLYKGHPKAWEEYKKTVGEYPKGTSGADFWLNFGTNILAQPGGRPILQTLGTAAKEPLLRMQEQKAMERHGEREESKDFLNTYLAAQATLRGGEAGAQREENFKHGDIAAKALDMQKQIYAHDSEWKDNFTPEEKIAWDQKKKLINLQMGKFQELTGIDLEFIMTKLGDDGMARIQNEFRGLVAKDETKMILEDGTPAMDPDDSTTQLTVSEYYKLPENHGKLEFKILQMIGRKLLELQRDMEKEHRDKTYGWTHAEGGRAGYQGGELVEQEDVNIMTPRGDVSMQETVEEGVEPDQLSFQELRSRLPAEVTDDIIRLITNSAEALTDFAKIQTQQDVDNFNAKYGVNLVLPSEA